MTDKIRIGVIGTSWWADLGHLPFLTSDKRVKVVAICRRLLVMAPQSQHAHKAKIDSASRSTRSNGKPCPSAHALVHVTSSSCVRAAARSRS